MSLIGVIGSAARRRGGAALNLLDETGLGSASVALSCSRLLRSAYTGYAMKVRRSSDDALADVGFASGSVSMSSPVANLSAGSGATLADWLASDSAYCRTLYDQGGNGYDFEQATSANQPRFVNAGTIETQGSIPALYFDGSNDFLAINSTDASALETVMNGNTSASIVVNTISGTGFVFGKRSASNARCFAPLTGWGASVWTYALENVNIWSTGISDTGYKSVGIHRSGTSVEARANGSSTSSFTVSAGLSSGVTYEIDSSAAPEQMKLQELVIWPSALGATPIGDLEANQNAFYAIY
jgi:hypothetical protein